MSKVSTHNIYPIKMLEMEIMPSEGKGGAFKLKESQSHTNKKVLLNKH